MAQWQLWFLTVAGFFWWTAATGGAVHRFFSYCGRLLGCAIARCTGFFLVVDSGGAVVDAGSNRNMPLKYVDSSLAASRRYSTTPSSSFMQRVPRLDVCCLCHASLALRARCVPSLPSLRHSTRACGIERTTVAMLNDGVSRMERLNARSRSSTVIAQRSQPTGSVDFLLEPLPSACARDTSRVHRHPSLGLLTASIQHAPRLLRPSEWTWWR